MFRSFARWFVAYLNVAGRFGIRPGKLFCLNEREIFFQSTIFEHPEVQVLRAEGKLAGGQSPNVFPGCQVPSVRGQLASLANGVSWDGLVAFHLGGSPARRVIPTRHLDFPFWEKKGYRFSLAKLKLLDAHSLGAWGSGEANCDPSAQRDFPK